MATPYNLRAGLQRAGRAEASKLRDPGDGGTIVASPNGDLTYVIVEGGTTRVLDPASRYPVGTRLMVICQTSTITISTVAPGNVALDDGEFLEVAITLDASGNKQWAELTSSNTAGVTPASAGTYEFLSTATAQDCVDGILAIVSALDTAGLIDGSGITQA